MVKPAIVALLLFWSIPAVAWNSSNEASGALADYLKGMRAANTAVFISACQLDEHIKAVVVFPVGSTSGELFVIADMTNDGTAYAAITGKVSTGSGQPEVLSTSVSSSGQQLYQQLAQNLLRSPFWILPTSRLNTIFTEPVQQLC